MIRGRLRVCLLVALVAYALSAGRTFAEGYAFSGLKVSNLNVFLYSSVADPTNLAQGPYRDGTGSLVDLSDLNSGGGGTGSNKRADLESTHATGSFATCLGTCLKGPDDYTRPPGQPTDPLNNVQFARTNFDLAGSLFTVSHIKNAVQLNYYAELELNSAATGRPADALSSLQLLRFFSVRNADRMVFDFDADVFMRALRQPGLPLSRVDASSTFRITLADNVGNTLLEFAPNGTGAGYVGATVVADPFNLNNHTTVQPPYLSSDMQFASAAQFRVITPLLTPGVPYTLTIRSGATVTAVPEPSVASLVGLAATLTSTLRRRGHNTWRNS